ncbi:MAG: putative OmpR family two-component system response regulator [Massilibacillus sp.]|jgi:DNA-binding response OmpR family regulator|nr:putative OmpR family two-component system response regulator [Massilibacillus sp.]
MRILLAEDDKRLGNLIKYMLEQKQVAVDWVVSGDMAYEYAMYDEYDVLILDWMMPIESGISACKRLRENGYQKAIMMLTARDDVEDRVAGLDTGADDYLVKPFEFNELFARIRALGRRSSSKLQQDTLSVGDLILNRNNKMIEKAGVQVQLSPREFQILDLFVQNRGNVVSRDILLDRVWGMETEVSSNNIDAYIKFLRKKIESCNSQIIIQTIRGIGYKLEE